MSQPCPTMDLSPWAPPGPGNSSQLFLYIQLRNVIGAEHLNQCWALLSLTQLFPGTANKTPIFCTVTLESGSSTWGKVWPEEATECCKAQVTHLLQWWKAQLSTLLWFVKMQAGQD